MNDTIYLDNQDLCQAIANYLVQNGKMVEGQGCEIELNVKFNKFSAYVKPY